MFRFVDLTGETFGRLTVVNKAGSSSKGYAVWVCLCECGEFTHVRSDKLKSGNTRSCGCLSVDTFGAKKIKHGLSSHKLYGVWRGMKQRCSDPFKQGYENYGGRGISVCDEWKADFKQFFDWCKNNGYEEGLQIDRIDNDGNYAPENCRFVTPSENKKNQFRKENKSDQS